MQYTLLQRLSLAPRGVSAGIASPKIPGGKRIFSVSNKASLSSDANTPVIPKGSPYYDSHVRFLTICGQFGSF